ncbi:MAG: hypothetical protein E7378_00560 [Clostridiales bacterium]|nr:hypothetical protein [Clostridiales bacterium]
MKKKSLKVAHGLIKFTLSFMLIFVIAGLGVAIYNLINFDPDIIKYVYVALGTFIIPLEFLITEQIGAFNQQGNNVFALIIAVALFAIIVALFVNLSKMHNDRLSSQKRTSAGIFCCVLIMIFAGIFALSVQVWSANQEALTTILNSNSAQFVQMLIRNSGLEIAFFKEIILSVLGLGLCLASGILLIVGMSKGSTKVKMVNSIYFYSSEYEQKQEPKPETTLDATLKQPKQDDTPAERTMQTVAKSKDPRSDKLVKKIMILDKLRQSGKLSDVEYVRLRQSAIKRYK